MKEKQIDLPGACKAWIEAQKAGGTMVTQRHNQMMNIEHAIPITPHRKESKDIKFFIVEMRSVDSVKVLKHSLKDQTSVGYFSFTHQINQISMVRMVLQNLWQHISQSDVWLER